MQKYIKISLLTFFTIFALWGHPALAQSTPSWLQSYEGEETAEKPQKSAKKQKDEEPVTEDNFSKLKVQMGGLSGEEATGKASFWGRDFGLGSLFGKSASTNPAARLASTPLTSGGTTPLHLVTFNKNTTALQSMLEQGASPDVQTASGLAPLHIAVMQTDPRSMIAEAIAQRSELSNVKYDTITDVLVAADADMNIKNNYNETPLHLAAYNGKETTIKKLITNKTDLNAQDIKGRTPLHNAVAGRNTKPLQALIQAGANINAQDYLGNTPLHAAAQLNNVGALKLLMQAGANPNIQNEFEQTPLHLAIEKNSPTAVQFLLNITAGEDKIPSYKYIKDTQPQRKILNPHATPADPTLTMNDITPKELALYKMDQTTTVWQKKNYQQILNDLEKQTGKTTARLPGSIEAAYKKHQIKMQRVKFDTVMNVEKTVQKHTVENRKKLAVIQ